MNKKQNDRLMYTVMVIGIVIAYIAFSYAADCYAAYQNSLQDISHLSQRQGGKALYFGYDGSNEWLTDVFCKEGICTYFTNLTLHFDRQHSEKMTRVYLEPPAESPFRFVSGKMPEADCGENAAVLGIRCKSDTYQKDGRDYITICGEEYCVTGYISEKNSTVVDNLVMLFWKQCGDNVKKAVDFFASSPMQVCVVFEDCDMEAWYYEHSGLLEKYAKDIRLSDNYDDGYTVEFNEYYLKLSYLLYAFSLIVLAIIIKYWIAMHTEEFVVRRIVGYERFQLMAYVGGRLCKTLLYVTVPCLLVQIVMERLSGSLVDASLGLFKVLSAAGFCTVTFILLLIYPMYRIMVKDIISERKGF